MGDAVTNTSPTAVTNTVTNTVTVGINVIIKRFVMYIVTIPFATLQFVTTIGYVAISVNSISGLTLSLGLTLSG